MKFCIHCKHYLESHPDPKGWTDDHWCIIFTNLVTGEKNPMPCNWMREPGTDRQCGPEGKLFDERNERHAPAQGPRTRRFTLKNIPAREGWQA